MCVLYLYKYLNGIKNNANELKKHKKCIDCKFYVDMDYQKDIQNACSNGNIVFGYIPMEADKFWVYIL